MSNRFQSMLVGVSSLLMAGTALSGSLGAAQAEPEKTELHAAVAKEYDSHLADLFTWFHQNPELSLQETKTAARLAQELEAAGFEVTQGIGKTGLVAVMKNGDGPTVLMRADMDGLPVQEKSGLSYASHATQADPNGVMQPVMHACGHDVHITSLVGTARLMASMKDKWSGTLMLLGQPAEERFGGARIMREDGLYDKFPKPDYAFAFHVNSQMEGGKIWVADEAAYAGVESVNITVHGVGAHGAAPHAGKDPIVLASQIVMGLQTLISREISPRTPGVVTVGSFHSGSKHNIISDEAKLQLTVRYDDLETRDTLLAGIKRIAENMGRVAGLKEDQLPSVEVLSTEAYPPTRNTTDLVGRVKKVWAEKLGNDIFAANYKSLSMGAEDFPFLVTDLETFDPIVPSVYFAVGGTPKADFDAAANGGEPVASHHSPLFKVNPDMSVPVGVEATIVALLEMMPKK